MLTIKNQLRNPSSAQLDSCTTMRCLDGERPSSGAASRGLEGAEELSGAHASTDVAAPEDRRSPMVLSRFARCSAFNSFNSFNLFNFSFILLLLATGCTPAGPKALVQGEKLIDKAKYTQAI